MGADNTSWGRRGSFRGWVKLWAFPDELFLGTFADDPPPGAVQLSAPAAAARMQGWMAAASADGLALLELSVFLDRAPPSSAAERLALQAALLTGLASGRLRVFTRPLAAPIAPTTQDDHPLPTAPSQPRKADETTWIAIRLVDESDPPKPVPFKRYRIELPDYSVREGRLDQNGQAKIVGIDSGMCQVTFLDHDASEWRAQ